MVCAGIITGAGVITVVRNIASVRIVANVVTGARLITVVMADVITVGMTDIAVGVELVRLPALLRDAGAVIIHAIRAFPGLLAQPCGLNLRSLGLGLGLLALRLALAEIEFAGLRFRAHLVRALAQLLSMAF